MTTESFLTFLFGALLGLGGVGIGNAFYLLVDRFGWRGWNADD